MGGRLCLHFYQDFPELVKRLVLVAPDGLKVNFWYWLSTQTILGNRFFRYTMEHPGWFLGSVNRLGKYGILNKGIVKYTGRYLGEAVNRKNLYTIWTCMRAFRPDLRRIKSLIRLRRPEVRMVFGHYDQVIRPSQGYRFLQDTGGHCTLQELPTGHQLLLPAFSQACLQIVTD
jgi:pimeloyl-ACP methyl ester carboxylesterase